MHTYKYINHVCAAVCIFTKQTHPCAATQIKKQNITDTSGNLSCLPSVTALPTPQRLMFLRLLKLAFTILTCIEMES